MPSAGVTTDFLIYSIIIPVMPFHLQALGYSEVSSLVGYLLFAYVRIYIRLKLFTVPTHFRYLV